MIRWPVFFLFLKAVWSTFGCGCSERASRHFWPDIFWVKEKKGRQGKFFLLLYNRCFHIWKWDWVQVSNVHLIRNQKLGVGCKTNWLKVWPVVQRTFADSRDRLVFRFTESLRVTDLMRVDDDLLFNFVFILQQNKNYKTYFPPQKKPSLNFGSYGMLATPIILNFSSHFLLKNTCFLKGFNWCPTRTYAWVIIRRQFTPTEIFYEVYSGNHSQTRFC